jgi:hypothetical protein
MEHEMHLQRLRLGEPAGPHQALQLFVEMGIAHRVRRPRRDNEVELLHEHGHDIKLQRGQAASARHGAQPVLRQRP